MFMQINRVNSVNISDETIPSQAAQAEGVTTRAQARSAKWHEAPGPLVGEEIVCSTGRPVAAHSSGHGVTNHAEREAITMCSLPVSMFCTAPQPITTNSPSGCSPKKSISRKCNVCGQTKAAADLVASKRYRDGYMPLCKPCRNEYWRERHSMNPEAKKAHGDNVRRSRLLSDYGLTEADYDRMLAEQGGKCKLCGTDKHGRGPRFRYWNVDHNHKTGAVRGLLCHTCNITIGKYEVLIGKVGIDAISEYIKEI